MHVKNPLNNLNATPQMTTDIPLITVIGIQVVVLEVRVVVIQEVLEDIPVVQVDIPVVLEDIPVVLGDTPVLQEVFLEATPLTLMIDIQHRVTQVATVILEVTLGLIVIHRVWNGIQCQEEIDTHRVWIAILLVWIVILLVWIVFLVDQVVYPQVEIVTLRMTDSRVPIQAVIDIPVVPWIVLVQVVNIQWVWYLTTTAILLSMIIDCRWILLIDMLRWMVDQVPTRKVATPKVPNIIHPEEGRRQVVLTRVTTFLSTHK